MSARFAKSLPNSVRKILSNHADIAGDKKFTIGVFEYSGVIFWCFFLSKLLNFKVLFGFGVAVFLCAVILLAWLRFSPVTVAADWKYDVLQENLDRITSLARLSDGRLLATLSAKQRAGQLGGGQLVQLDIAGGKYTVLAGKLYKPDGLMPYKNGVVITQEFSDQPVLLWSESRINPIFMLVKPESITATQNGRWLIVEDAMNGRLIEFNPQDGKQAILYTGFEAGEGVCVGRDQRIFVVDNKGSDLLEFVNGEMKKIVSGLNGPGFLRCTDSGIWITEDVTNNGRLLFYDYQNLQVLARHLHSPQSVLEDGDNSILVAEQGRSRLLRFSKR